VRREKQRRGQRKRRGKKTGVPEDRLAWRGRPKEKGKDLYKEEGEGGRSTYIAALNSLTRCSSSKLRRYASCLLQCRPLASISPGTKKDNIREKSNPKEKDKNSKKAQTP
jgi:hypothetical protein